MAEFVRVESRRAVADAANMTHFALVHPGLLAKEVDYWAAMATNVAEPDGPESNRLASLLLERAKQALEMGSAALEAAGQRMNSLDFMSALIVVSARHAFSRFVRMGGLATASYSNESSAYAATPSRKLLIDYQMKAQPDGRPEGAYSITVGQEWGLWEKFGGSPWQPKRGRAWYYSSEEGLYVRARWPANPSPELKDSLTIATGSPENADALIDAHNSLEVLPYLSISYLSQQTLE